MSAGYIECYMLSTQSNIMICLHKHSSGIGKKKKRKENQKEKVKIELLIKQGPLSLTGLVVDTQCQYNVCRGTPLC